MAAGVALGIAARASPGSFRPPEQHHLAQGARMVDMGHTATW